MSAAALPYRKRFADDRERVLVTPEGIALPLTLASRGSRFGALLLDLVIIVVLIVATTLGLLFAAGGTLNSLENDTSAAGRALQFFAVLWIAAMFLFRNAYFLFFELGPRGATPGKRMTGIRIAARDGGRLSAEMVIARNLLRDIELFLPLVFVASASGGGDEGAAGLAAAAWFLIFALFPCFNKDRLRAGDLIAGTWVVEAPKRKLEQTMSAVAAPSPDDHAYKFGDAELAPYGEYELQTLERVLRENRAEALTSVAEAICAKIGWSPPTGGHERGFLEAYYTQLRAHLETGMRFGQRKADKFEASLAGKASAIRFGEAELAVYGENQLHSLERVLREGDPAALHSVASAIAGKIGRAEPHPEAQRAFLEAYYTQLRARLARGR
ncbi:MAG: RDD family protein [Novosphingobium sp.]